MNAMVEMPDVGGIKAEHFVNQQYVFTGHFHKRQIEATIFTTWAMHFHTTTQMLAMMSVA
jgi:hypothetical protein